MRPPESTLGVEEEFHVVAPESWRVTNDGGRVLQHLPDGSDHFTGELLQSAVETCTPVCDDLAGVRRELEATRLSVVTAARAAGRRLAAAGTMPFAVAEPEITDGARYADILALHQRVALEQVVCGCHVHVGIADPETAVAIANRVSPWLPVLLALSANSPYHGGIDTGFASYRTVVWTRWPSATPWPGFGSVAGYEELVRDLIATGAITDRGQIYWDLRLSQDNPTLEFRIADACLSIDETLLQAALCRALVRTAWQEIAAGLPAPTVGREVLMAARWKAARFGLQGDLVDVRVPVARPARDVVDGLLDHVDDALRVDRCRDEVRTLVEVALREGTGSQRQRQVQETGGSLHDVVEMLVHETAHGLDPDTVALPA